jgi:hypothetical protein
MTTAVYLFFLPDNQLNKHKRKLFTEKKMSKTKKISISVKKGNEDSIDLMDAYADRCSLSRSDFIFKLFNQYHYTQLKGYRNA